VGAKGGKGESGKKRKSLIPMPKHRKWGSPKREREGIKREELVERETTGGKRHGGVRRGSSHDLTLGDAPPKRFTANWLSQLNEQRHQAKREREGVGCWEGGGGEGTFS